MRISDHHRDLYRRYYENKEVRIRPNSWLTRIEKIADEIAATSIIDYGCGIARGVSQFSRFPVVDYDPGVVGCDAEPAPADLVVSIHALEHVEPPTIKAVLEHMESLAKIAVMIVVSCKTSTKTLSDGTPWHTCVLEPEQWRCLLHKYEPLDSLRDNEWEFAAVLKKR